MARPVAKKVQPIAVDEVIDPVVESAVEPVAAAEPIEAPKPVEVPQPVAAQTPQRTSVQRVVFHQVKGMAAVGQFLTVIVMGNQTVILELDQPKEVAADVAAALIALESPLYVIQPA